MEATLSKPLYKRQVRPLNSSVKQKLYLKIGVGN